jgi:hypothetical protein
VRVLAARFRNRETAAAALRAIRERLRLDIEDAAIAPLGWPGRDDAAEETVLAGRFQDHHTFSVRDLIGRHGGVVVADVDELWTRPRIPVTGDAASRPAIQPHPERLTVS